ncbi:MAG TPA: hypothetical protein VFD82_01100 [Planctomycetota bacterium]|nr:hypothetical protein [Planctomycetota bacterium]
MSSPLTRLFTFLALAVPTLMFAGHASAQARPYHANGTAQFAPNQSDFTGSGNATHLGSYTEVGHVTFTGTGTPGVLAVNGWAHYTAANGHVLCAAISGTVNQQTGAIQGTATYIGGTGHFANASGSSALTGQMLGGGALTISALGSISY